MPQNKEVHRQYMRRRREGSQKGSQTGGGSQVHPAILRAITDPKIRPKIERISLGLNSQGLGNDVTYGTDGPTFDIVAQLLEVTR